MKAWSSQDILEPQGLQVTEVPISEYEVAMKQSLVDDSKVRHLEDLGKVGRYDIRYKLYVVSRYGQGPKNRKEQK